MKKRHHGAIYLVVGAVIALLFGLSSFATAQVMTSTDFKIQSDSINVGGVPGTSPDFKINDTTGEVGTGPSTGTDFKLLAGYQQVEGGTISITAASDITLTPLSLTQSSAVGSTTWSVTTNNPAGYTLTVNASAAPALSDSGTGEAFTDYTEAVAGVKETWSVSNGYEFGFSGLGLHVSGYGTDTDCIDAENVPSTGLLWEGFNGTTQIELASSTSVASGVSTSICVATEQDTLLAPSGSYSATITATATTQ